jgi:hypothetical protein
VWVRFVGDFDFSPAAFKGRVTLAYKAGTEANVIRECAALAIPAGKAVELKRENHQPRKISGQAESPATGGEGRDAQSNCGKRGRDR